MGRQLVHTLGAGLLASVLAGLGVWGATSQIDGPPARAAAAIPEPSGEEQVPSGEQNPSPSAGEDRPAPAVVESPASARALPAPPGPERPVPPGQERSARSAEEPPTTPAVASQVVASALRLPQARIASPGALARTVEQDLPEVAVGPMRAQLEAELIEMESHGWTREGSPELSEVRVVEDRTHAGEPALVVSACVDWSGVTYLAADGTPLPPNPTPRAAQTFTLTPNQDGHWVVSDHDVAPEPRC